MILIELKSHNPPARIMKYDSDNDMFFQATDTESNAKVYSALLKNNFENKSFKEIIEEENVKDDHSVLEYVEETDDTSSIEKINDDEDTGKLRTTDIICGLGSNWCTHNGNVTYRTIIEKYKQNFLSTAKVDKRKQIAELVLSEITSQDPPGRFMKHVSKNVYVELSNVKRRNKIFYSLHQINNKHGNEDNDDDNIDNTDYVDDDDDDVIGKEECEPITTLEVLRRIDEYIKSKNLHERKTNASNNRLKIAKHCKELLETNKTSTVRSIYYAEGFNCYSGVGEAVFPLCKILSVPRRMLNLPANPKGMYCGDIQLINGANEIQDTRTSSNPIIIQEEWQLPTSERILQLKTSRATCILVCETYCVFHYLFKEKFFDKYPCIIVTGIGFPELNTRAFVHTIHNELHLPVIGLSDGGPFCCRGLNVYSNSNTFCYCGTNYNVPVEWMGLHPSQIQSISKNIPKILDYVKQLTEPDEMHLRCLIKSGEEEADPWAKNSKRLKEFKTMRGKVEMEVLLYRLGSEFFIEWLGNLFDYNGLGTKNIYQRYKEDGDKKDLMMI